MKLNLSPFLFALSIMAFGFETSCEKEYMNRFTNRLIYEKSPYLLQHAYNPVDWHPWSEKAFEQAKKEDKPIFLSIGYAACHWCHVMEHESFENEEIAKLMNGAFICIKVDREERPDIDNIYMTACQIMTGQGGWPLTIIMTPDKKPFYAATYIPPEQRFGRIGMKQLIPRISLEWKNRRKKILESADRMIEVLNQQNTQGSEAELHPALLIKEGYQELLAQYDRKKGGFGHRPKFPTPHRLVFLLRQGQEKGIRAVEHTLKEMRKGGIFDQVGFGFHRYSTDESWLLPHFEKMLYDQALLAMAYTEAYELTRKPLYRQVTEEILEYVLRDMTSPEGAFYSAEDADSAGEEGLFYIWSAKEMKSILGSDFDWISDVWNIAKSGNFYDESTGLRNGKNIPYLSEFPTAEESKRIANARQKLLAVREKRIRPLKDTKVLADWNGLMIAAFAKAGRAFKEEKYVAAAVKANVFVESQMRRKNGRLWHRWREGEKAVPGQIEDYAFMIYGVLQLYDSTFNLEYLETALKYNDILSESFRDENKGGYFMTADDAEQLIVRPKELYDGAVPSGNSVQMYNLLKLTRLTGLAELERQAVETGRAYSGTIERSPSNFSQALTALQFAEEESLEIVVVGERDDKETCSLLDYIRSFYKPCKVVLFKDSKNAEKLARLAPFTKILKMEKGETTVYICRNFACENPAHSLYELKSRLENRPSL